MRIPTELAGSLYRAPQDADSKISAGNYTRYSNQQLLEYLSRPNLFNGMAAAVLLRPKMAIRYHLLPALAAAFSAARPTRNSSPVGRAVDILFRDLALLFDLAKPDWKELPQDWVILGSSLDQADFELAGSLLQQILESTPVAKPMAFLENFCRPGGEQPEWLRFFWLSDEDLAQLTAEKELAIAMITKNDEDHPQDG